MKQGHAHERTDRGSVWKPPALPAVDKPVTGRGPAERPAEPAKQETPTTPTADEGGMRLWGRCGYVPVSKAHEP